MICATTTSVPQIGWHLFLKVATPIYTLNKITYKAIVSCGFSLTSQDKSIHSLELYLDIPLKIIGQLHDFPLIVPSFSVLFHNLPMISNLVPMMFLYFHIIFPSCSYDVPIFPISFLWFSYDFLYFPIFFPWFFPRILVFRKALVDSDLLTLSAVGRSTEAQGVDLSGGKLLSDLALGRWDH